MLQAWTVNLVSTRTSMLHMARILTKLTKSSKPQVAEFAKVTGTKNPTDNSIGSVVFYTRTLRI